MYIGAISSVSAASVGGAFAFDTNMQSSIIAGASTNLSEPIMGAEQNASQGNGAGTNILSLSPTQDAVSGLISSVSGTGISLPGLAVPVTALGNSLKTGVTSLINAFNTMPEVPIPADKIEASQEVKSVAPSSGYNPNATSEELLEETYSTMEESRRLIGEYFEMTA